MGRDRRDLSIRENALASRNSSAMLGVTIMNLVLTLAYVVELVKKSRDVWSFLIVATLCLAPTIIGAIIYLKKAESVAIRYVYTIGFLLFYGYIMITTPSRLTFCYVLVLFSIFIVYEDLKICIGLGIVSFLINVAVVTKELITVGYTQQLLTDTEIMLACIAMSSLFAILAIRKISNIGDANVNKANYEKQQSERILETTLNVAANITDNIEAAVGETKQLNGAIDSTVRSMERLSDGTNDAVDAIRAQHQSTASINHHIQEVEDAAELIAKELARTEEQLRISQQCMDELLAQVQVSKGASEVASHELESLKHSADQMQIIVGLISNVANQTALLSLNASIEAARAGEAGRGFAVVASEISSLAAQSNSATDNIEKLITGITQSVQEVAKSMEEMLSSNELQNRYVEDTAENFRVIHECTDGISAQAGQLQRTVESVSVANKQVIAGINNVSAVTDDVSDSAEETLYNCNRNQESIEKVMQIMDALGKEAKRLQEGR